MANGGKRPGAGRKKGHKASHTIEAEKARAFVIGQVVERLLCILAFVNKRFGDVNSAPVRENWCFNL